MAINPPAGQRKTKPIQTQFKACARVSWVDTEGLAVQAVDKRRSDGTKKQAREVTQVEKYI